MDNEASSSEQKFKAVEFNNQIFHIPVRRIDHDQYLFLSDVQAIVPQASALTASDKLIPFETDPITHMELLPKRMSVSDFDSAWQVHVPEAAADSQRRMMDIDTKLERLSRQLHHVLSAITTSSSSSTSDAVAVAAVDDTASESNEHDGDVAPADTPQVTTRPQSPPPAFSSSPPLPVPSSRPSPPGHPSASPATAAQTSHTSNAARLPHPPQPPSPPPPPPPRPQHQQAPQPTTSTRHVEGDAPPSYETSILGNIKALTDQLRLYESHIANRHKSPRWLARRSEWVQREPSSIEQVAYQLVQLEMALLWTAVSESWIQEREMWLTLVASARTERHLAAAMLNLERHTLVMDESWGHHVRESWVNELLEMIVLPLTHGN